MHILTFCLALVSPALVAGPGIDDAPPMLKPVLQPMDVFALELASDPQISPDGSRIVYARVSMDVMTDRRRSRLWIVSDTGTNHRPLTAGAHGDESGARWSPDGTRLAFVGSDNGNPQIHVHWIDTGATSPVTQLTEPPGPLSWSPSGRELAFTAFVPAPPEPFVQMPSPPEGASWAEPPKVVRTLRWRADGVGELRPGYRHVFTVPADGGTPRRLTTGNFDHDGRPAWTPDGSQLVVSTRRFEDWERDPDQTDLFAITVEDGSLRKLTTRHGPDHSPAVSPDGNLVACIGFEDHYQGYQVSRLSVVPLHGGQPRLLTETLDRSISSPVWSADGRGLFAQYDDEGVTRIAWIPLEGNLEMVATDVGGLSLGRPYGGGSFSVADNGRFAFTACAADRPADISVGRRDNPVMARVTSLNEDLLGDRRLGQVHELWARSSHDDRAVQGWYVTPPDFDPSQRWPLLLEIHGGPFANYGPRFAAELQLYAAAGYVVLYVNPRGSTSYGEEFGNLIHHDYPGHDYEDLMSSVDALLERDFIDPERMFVTGGSGGGVLSAWIVGKTDRFRAAVVAKPVINWTSFVLTADAYPFFTRYWFPGMPWEYPEHYHARSPLSLVGNVSTPTMLLTGESDYRTPISESEQYYQALQLAHVETALVRVPGAGHGIAARPSNLIAKVLHVLKWFETHTPEPHSD